MLFPLALSKCHANLPACSWNARSNTEQCLGHVQEGPPRVLSYHPSSVHKFGWIPLNPLNWRNVKATVFSTWAIHIQTAALVAWAGIIHATGLGLKNYDLHGLLKTWGTTYAGTATHSHCGYKRQLQAIAWTKCYG
jgi:hypothetical protein